MIRIIDPGFFAKKMRALSLEKRAKQRELNLEKKTRDQALKLQQMLERATRPVKRRDGRPLTARVTPARRAKKDDEKALKEQLEKDRMDGLLFGPVFT
jgi:hypothetical protein